MIFTLEVLEAKHGDSLLLHYGPKTAPKLIVIDGGPRGVYKSTLRPRLQQIKDRLSPDKPLPVKMVMISHIDDDHIKGIIDLTDELLETEESERLCDITTLWHNSFDDILGNKEVEALAASLGSSVRLSSAGELMFPPGLFKDEGAAAVAANVSQGRDLRQNAESLSLLLNDPFEDLVILPGNKKPIKIDDLKFTIVGPTRMRLEKLEADWDKELPAIKAKGKKAAQALAAAFMDDSVYNLSSIVTLVEAKGKTMLLTGDALADDILAGLEESGRLKKGEKLHVDIFKMPHHGSIRNISKELLERVTAEHYVMSANGKYNNPDLDTLKLISQVRGDDEYTIHLTNPVPAAVDFYKKDRKKAGKKYRVAIRDGSALSFRIDLADPLND